MENTYDFYYSSKEANRLSDENVEITDKIKKVVKTFLHNKPFTEMVPFHELPKCGCANAEFIGTGLKTEVLTKGIW